jgi:hypothetical protein
VSEIRNLLPLSGLESAFAVWAFEDVRKRAQNVDRVSFLSANVVAAMNIQLAKLAPNGETHFGLRVCYFLLVMAKTVIYQPVIFSILLKGVTG